VTATPYARQAVADAASERLPARLSRMLAARLAVWRLAQGEKAERRARHWVAFRHFAAAAGAGNAEAQYRVGLAYASGKGVIRHPPDAVRWYRRAAQQGHLEAQFQLSLIYLHGQSEACADWYRAAVERDPRTAEWTRDLWFSAGLSVPCDYVEALRWSRLAAEQGQPDAQANLALLYLQGLGCERDEAAAHSWYERAAARGSAEAEYGLGMVYANGLGVAVDLTTAAQWYAAAADKGIDAAQVALGLMYASGQGAERNPDRAAALFRRAASRGNPRAHHNLGLLQLRGEGLPQDPEAAETCFRDAARLGYAPAMLSLAELYDKDESSGPDAVEAVFWYKAAAAAGNAEAQFRLGRLHISGAGVPQQPGEAARWFEQAAEQGHSVAQLNLAALYVQGLGVPPDRGKAIEWYARAAAQGLVAAQLRLADLYLHGEDGATDPESAAHWLRQAAEAGDADAQFRLAALHSLGEGVAHDPETAQHWYRLAAEQGNPFAQHNLAEMLSDGADPAPAEAARWYRKAAEQGLAEAQLALGDLYAIGRGVPHEPGAARAWYEKAAGQGHEEGLRRLSKLPEPLDMLADTPGSASQPADENLPDNAAEAPRKPAPAAAPSEPIRLVIWDLDETFWEGTLSEGGIRTYSRRNHEVVLTLARRGIMSSICSKNDRAAVRPILTEQGIWDYFIFPSIDWTAKAKRVADIIEAVQLRAATVLFIDDNPMNRAEVAARIPGIQIADVTIIPGMLDDPRFTGKNDAELTRLAQYKLLEKRNADRLVAGADDEAFLRASHIRVFIENDVSAHLDRAVELINRTNQLNFTKRRLPEDAAAARAQLGEEINPYYVRAGLLRVIHDYGDFGYCGLYRMVGSALLDYCFSCRILGMGVETWLYDRLDRPQITVRGEVLTDLSQPRDIDWITLVENEQADCTQSPPTIPEVRLRGGCDLDALAHYFRLTAGTIHAEMNRVREHLFVRMDSSLQILPSLFDPPPDFHSAMKMFGYKEEDFASDFLAPTAPGSILIYSPWADVYVSLYSHKTKGFVIPVNIGIYSDLTQISDEALAGALEELDATDAQKEQIRKIVTVLRADYTWEPCLSAAAATEILRTMFNRIPQGARLFVVLPYELMKLDDTLVPRPSAIEYNAAIRILACGYRNVSLLPMNELVNGKEELQQAFDLFDRIIYFRMYQWIRRELQIGADRGPAFEAPGESSAMRSIVAGEPIRLVIWGLDEVEDKGEVVVALARRGIISSICWKNRDVAAAQTMLEQSSVRDYLIFPSIDWTAKGRRVAAIIAAAELRATTVLFVDRNPMERAEVAALVPGIQIADPAILGDMLSDPRFAGEADQDLTRLARLKRIEAQDTERSREIPGGRGDTGQWASATRFEVDVDVAAHLDRAIELIAGTRQLNFTKRQLPRTIEAARAQLLAEIAPYWVHAGLVRVVDDSEDCGYCGFYMMVGSQLFDYCFSRRVLGRGIESTLYQRLGQPAITVSGPVAADLSPPRNPGPVTVTIGSAVEGARRAAPIPEVRLRGGSDLDALTHYFRLVCGTVRAETNRYHGPLFLQRDSTALLGLALGAVPSAFYAAARRLGYVEEDFASDFLSPAPPGSILVYSGWGDVHLTVYRHKTTGFTVPVNLDLYEDLTAIGDEALAEALSRLSVDEVQKAQIREIIGVLGADYTAESPISIDTATGILRRIFGRIPEGARLFIVLPYEWIKWEGALLPRASAIEYNHAVRKLARDFEAVSLVSMNDVVAGAGEMLVESDTFERMVYFRMYDRIMTELGSAGSARNTADHGALVAV
jgi:FkbH-like protein